MAKKTAARRSSAGGGAPAKLASPVKTSTASAKPLPISQASDNESDAEEDGDLSDEDEDEDEDEDDEQGDESEDVTPEALERMMQLLGDDVDAAELGLLSGMTAEDDDDEEEDDEDDEDKEEDDSDDSDDDEEDLEEGDSEMIPYEAIQDADQEDLVPVEKTTVNDKVALERVLASFKTDAGFFDTLTLTNPKPLNVPDANNDLERELEFYKQSLWAAMHAESLFEKASLPFHRPTDYFAEMVKTDAHMAQIRQSLLDEQAGMKASEDARKLRDAKKFGKKVQHERLRERERDKKAIGEKLDSLKKKRKGDSSFGNEDFEVALEDALASGASSNANKKRKPNESERPGRAKRGLSRDSRDKKYGFGGGKDGGRRGKQNNDREDGERGSGAFGGGGGGRGGGRGGRGGGGRGGGRGGGARGGAAKRPGKSRRH